MSQNYILDDTLNNDTPSGDNDSNHNRDDDYDNFNGDDSNDNNHDNDHNNNDNDNANDASGDHTFICQTMHVSGAENNNRSLGNDQTKR